MQRKFVIEKIESQEIEVSRVMYKLSSGAVDLCGERTGGTVGATMMTGAGIPADYRAIARTDYGLDDGLTVIAVEPGSPAAQAGLMTGDHLVALNGTAVALTAKSQNALHAALKQGADTNAAVTLSIRRDGAMLDKNLVPVRACDYPSTVVQNKEINAVADGNQIFVYTGLLDFTHSDEELATVLSHEMSHNILGHIAKKKENALAGGALGLAADILVAATTGVNPGFTRAGAAAGMSAYSVRFEQEADYEGLYVMQHAGYALDESPDIWRRMAIENPDTINLRTTHPTSPERFVALTNTIAEIKAKQTQGVAMLPNLQPGQVAASRLAQTPAAGPNAAAALKDKSSP